MVKQHSSWADRWVWIDLEMTGLDENNCCILEAAMVITDTNLKEISSTSLAIWQPESALETMIPFVKKMHTKNQLLTKVRSSSISLQEAENQLLELLTSEVKYKRGILAGNSVYMDRKFLQKYMPGITSYLHYQQIDVSSVKILCQKWYGPKGIAEKGTSSHTALEDIRASINELKFYKSVCFRSNLD